MADLPPEVVGVAAGISLSALNAGAGYLLARRSSKLPLKKALGIVVGGMVVRLFIVAILTWMALSFWNLHVASFTLALMISFFLLLMIETFFFHTTTKAAPKPYYRKRRVKRDE